MTDAARPGEKQFPHLFEKYTFGKFELSNRVKYGACCVSNFNTREGFITPRELARMKVIAQSGCAMITNQGATPDPKGEGKGYFSQISLHDDKFLPQFEEIAGYIHDAGAMAVQQILHAGRYGGIDLGYCVQPSTVPQTLPHFRPPREMTKEQIRETIRYHSEACVRALKAGFDAVEITSFMGYLLANFCSKFTNQRTDEYGGSIENRGRFLRELIIDIKDHIGDVPLSVRMNGAELMDKWGGDTEDECFEFIHQAAEAGADMLSITVGWQESPSSSIGRDVPPGHWNYLAARCKKELPDVPVAFGVRLPDPAMAEKCIAEGAFDIWEVCRPLLADPQLIKKTLEGRLDEVKKCVGSLNCLSRLFRDLPYTCTANPALGHEVEPEYNITPAAVQKKIMVVGGGPCGLEFAIAASQRGHEVTIFEKSDRLGGALRGYARHDMANRDELHSLIEYYETMMKKRGIEVKLNTAPDMKMMRGLVHVYDVVIMATGASVDQAQLPEPEDGVALVDGHEASLGLAEIGQRAVVLGGGQLGLTLAESLADADHQVVVVEPGKQVGADLSPTWKWRHKQWLAGLKVETLTRTRAIAVTRAGVTVVDGEGGERMLEADTVIAAGPVVSNQQLFHDFRWMVDELHGAGDAVVPRDLTQAIHEGYRLGCQI